MSVVFFLKTQNRISQKKRRKDVSDFWVLRPSADYVFKGAIWFHRAKLLCPIRHIKTRGIADAFEQPIKRCE